MIVNDADALEACKLTPSAALDLLDQGRAGESKALAKWAIYSIHRALRQLGASSAGAVHHALRLARSLDISVSIRS